MTYLIEDYATGTCFEELTDPKAVIRIIEYYFAVDRGMYEFDNRLLIDVINDFNLLCDICKKDLHLSAEVSLKETEPEKRGIYFLLSDKRFNVNDFYKFCVAEFEFDEDLQLSQLDCDCDDPVKWLLRDINSLNISIKTEYGANDGHIYTVRLKEKRDQFINMSQDGDLNSTHFISDLEEWLEKAGA